ncbi:hypothetical protein CEXT_475241 [Caerostris extrusa]|uniref:Uncharacterized protein n=1 Tax=Caerostris extrusa TaxID=172846 RepID=A0AAV4SU19_CAEEX|nr:hypothetical protein CEXT_475241 [Caerostris extrusa]
MVSIAIWYSSTGDIIVLVESFQWWHLLHLWHSSTGCCLLPRLRQKQTNEATAHFAGISGGAGFELLQKRFLLLLGVKTMG